MKVTDYMPRPGLLEFYLTEDHLVGAEIGVDVGAHAESLLKNCNIKMLHLIDSWDREFNYAYCVGRLHTKGYKNKTNFIHKTSDKALGQIDDRSLDFIYFDSEYDDYEVVKKNLDSWLVKLKPNSYIAHRGYFTRKGVQEAIGDFVDRNDCHICGSSEHYHDEVVILIN